MVSSDLGSDDMGVLPGAVEQNNSHLPGSLEPHDLLPMIKGNFFLVLAPAFAPLEPYEQ